jgi:hypothetical protein
LQVFFGVQYSPDFCPERRGKEETKREASSNGDNFRVKKMVKIEVTVLTSVGLIIIVVRIFYY